MYKNMKASRILLSTQKVCSEEIKMKSHDYMTRAGLIRKFSSGVYTWLPLGMRVLNKMKELIKKEMENVHPGL